MIEMEIAGHCFLNRKSGTFETHLHGIILLFIQVESPGKKGYLDGVNCYPLEGVTASYMYMSWKPPDIHACRIVFSDRPPTIIICMTNGPHLQSN